MTWIDWLRFAGSLAVVIGLIVGLRWLLDRMDGRAGFGAFLKPSRVADADTPDIRMRRMIDARHTLVVVRWHGTDHLVLLGPQGSTLVGTQPATPPVDE